MAFDAKMATKWALNEIASREAGFVRNCRTAQQINRKIIVVITTCFDQSLQQASHRTKSKRIASHRSAHFKPCSSWQAKHEARALQRAPCGTYMQSAIVLGCLGDAPRQLAPRQLALPACRDLPATSGIEQAQTNRQSTIILPQCRRCNPRTIPHLYTRPHHPQRQGRPHHPQRHIIL